MSPPVLVIERAQDLPPPGRQAGEPHRIRREVVAPSIDRRGGTLEHSVLLLAAAGGRSGRDDLVDVGLGEPCLRDAEVTHQAV
jgi:hypothetical protein